MECWRESQEALVSLIWGCLVYEKVRGSMIMDYPFPTFYVIFREGSIRNYCHTKLSCCIILLRFQIGDALFALLLCLVT